MPGWKQACPIVAACWSPATPRIGISAPNSDFSVTPKSAAQSFTSGSSPAGMRRIFRSSASHSVRDDVVDQRARGVGRIGDVRLAAGQPPDQETVDGAGQQLAAFGALARAFHIVEQPGDLGAGKIGIEQQPGLLREFLLQPLLLQFLAKCRGSPVLPDDGVVDRLAGRLVPDDDGLALVGDADRRDVASVEPGRLQRLAAGRNDALPDLFGIVLDPSRRRVMLREFLLAGGDDLHRAVEHDGAARCRALVDRQNETAHVSLIVDMIGGDGLTPPPPFSRLIAAASEAYLLQLFTSSS